MNQERGRFLQLHRLKTSLPKRNQPSFLKHSSDLCLGWKCPAVVIFIFWITVHETHSVSLWEGGIVLPQALHCNSSQEVRVLCFLSFLRPRHDCFSAAFRFPGSKQKGRRFCELSLIICSPSTRTLGTVYLNLTAKETNTCPLSLSVGTGPLSPPVHPQLYP